MSFFFVDNDPSHEKEQGHMKVSRTFFMSFASSDYSSLSCKKKSDHTTCRLAGSRKWGQWMIYLSIQINGAGTYLE